VPHTSRTQRPDHIVTGEYAVAAQPARAYKHIAQLTHIAGPAVLAQHRHRVAIDDGRQSHAAQQGGHQQVQVRRSRSKRRHVHPQDVQAVQEVLAKRALRGHRAQVTMRRRDHTHVHNMRALAAQRANAHRLEKSQQLRLLLQRQLTDLIQEERAVVSALKSAPIGGGSAGKRTPDVAEEL